MKLTLFLFACVLFALTSTQSHANLFTNILERVEPSFMVNCDSEDVKEYRDYDYKNPPSSYNSKTHWFNEIEKAERRQDHCRKSQALYHLVNFLPWKEYHELEVHKQVVESLYKGKYFLELQWQIRNYREMYGKDVEIEAMQVMSYWPYVDKINQSQKCIAPTGYYPNPKTGKEHDIVTEAFLSANDFLRDFSDSSFAKVVQDKLSALKDARVLKLMCTAKNSLSTLERRSDSKNNAYHYFAIYKRLSEVIVNFKEQEGIDETIYMLIGICNKIHQKTQRGVFTSGAFQGHPDEFIFDENWLDKSSKLKEILVENFPQSPWLAKLK